MLRQNSFLQAACLDSMHASSSNHDLGPFIRSRGQEEEGELERMTTTMTIRKQVREQVCLLPPPMSHRTRAGSTWTDVEASLSEI